MPKSLEDGLMFATGREHEDDRDFLKQVIAEGPYRAPVVDLGLSACAAHLLHIDRGLQDYLPWITDNCQHCRAGLLSDIDHLLSVLRR